MLSVPKKYFYHAAQFFETLKKFQKLLFLMVRDTLLGFPSRALPYRYRNSYHFIDRLRFLSFFRITAKEHIRPEFIGVAVLGVPLVVILFYLVRIGVFL